MFGFFVTFVIVSIASCKWPNSYITSNSSLTTGCNKLTNVQNRVRSSIMAARNERRSTSSKSALRCVISCIDDSTKLWIESDWPFFAFFCKRSVSVDRFFSSARQRLYSFACSLSITATWRFQSSTLSYKNVKFVCFLMFGLCFFFLHLCNCILNSFISFFKLRISSAKNCKSVMNR